MQRRSGFRVAVPEASALRQAVEGADGDSFGIVFVAATIAFTVVIQGFYHKQALFEKATFADEVIGGLLGIVQALFLIGAARRALEGRMARPGVVMTNFYKELARR